MFVPRLGYGSDLLFVVFLMSVVFGQIALQNVISVWVLEVESDKNLVFVLRPNWGMINAFLLSSADYG